MKKSVECRCGLEIIYDTNPLENELWYCQPCHSNCKIVIDCPGCGKLVSVCLKCGQVVMNE